MTGDDLIRDLRLLLPVDWAKQVNLSVSMADSDEIVVTKLKHIEIHDDVTLILTDE